MKDTLKTGCLNMFGFILLVAVMMSIGFYCESKKDPYEEGTHMDYSIHCENGFVYKIKNRASIQVLNSDGTPLRCGQKIY